MLISKFNTINVQSFIDLFELKHNFKFPKQYRDFLLKYNGGRTPDTSFKFNKISSDIEGFYGVGEADDDFNYDNINLTEFLADGYIPIGENCFGDYIILEVGADNAKVFFYYHDRPKKYIELCNSFKEFAEKCTSEKIGKIETIEERRAYMISLGKEDRITPERLAGWQAEIDEYSGINQEKLLLE